MGHRDPKPTFHHRASSAVSVAVGHVNVLALTCGLVAVWLIVEFAVGFSSEWLITTNIFASVAIFLILFAIRHSQQLYKRSIHAKLDELIRSGDGESRLIASERLADEMMEKLRAKHREMAEKDRS